MQDLPYCPAQIGLERLAVHNGSDGQVHGIIQPLRRPQGQVELVDQEEMTHKNSKTEDEPMSGLVFCVLDWSSS